MKRKRAQKSARNREPKKKAKLEYNTKSKNKENIVPLPAIIQPQPQNPSKIYCLFCYKATSINPPPAPAKSKRNSKANAAIPYPTNEHSTRLETCKNFYNQLVNSSSTSTETDFALPPFPCWNDGKTNPNNGKIDIFSKFPKTVYSACQDCAYVVQLYNELFQQIQGLQQTLKGHLQSLFNVMKSATKVPSRVQAFSNSFFPEQSPAPSPAKNNKKLKMRMSKIKKIEMKQNQQKLETILKVRKRILKTCKHH